MSWKSVVPVVVVSSLAAIAAPSLAQTRDQPGCALGASIPNVSMNCPDLYAWQVFAQVVKPVAPSQTPTFQTWSTDPETFPCPPTTQAICDVNPSSPGCPVWPVDFSGLKASGFTQRSSVPAKLKVQHPPAALTGASSQITNCWLANNTEIVHRNKAAFDYIVENGLWYQEGSAQAFLKGLDINFPVDAIEVKTNWKLLGSQDNPARYQTMTLTSGLYGLIAMHISTKALPNWFWSTFEHVDNPGRCDFLGCWDSFGFTPAYVAPHDGPQCGQYPPGSPTAGWEKLGLASQWRNYRLKGSMTDFTSPTGKPNLLGNSVTEATFVQTASCMTCHSRATVNVSGISPYPEVAGFTPDSQSYNGTPNPNWYYANLNPGTSWSLQTDFVWAIPFKAYSVTATAACCADPNGPSANACQPTN